VLASSRNHLTHYTHAHTHTALRLRPALACASLSATSNTLFIISSGGACLRSRMCCNCAQTWSTFIVCLRTGLACDLGPAVSQRYDTCAFHATAASTPPGYWYRVEDTTFCYCGGNRTCCLVFSWGRRYEIGMDGCRMKGELIFSRCAPPAWGGACGKGREAQSKKNPPNYKIIR
jgi:hypothetical protein